MTAIPDSFSPTRHLVTEIPGPRSLELMARRQRAIPSGVGTTLPVFVTRAGPGILEDVDGNRLIDFGSGISTTNVGNSAPLVVAAIAEQAALFTHTCFQVTPYAGYVEVCERLNELTPGSHEKRSFLVNSGAEAVENAVKVARYATGRPGVVAFDHGFHGRTLLALTLTGKVHPYKQGFGPFVPEIYRAPYSDPFRETGRLGDTITMLETTVGAETIAAVLVEPIAGEGGVVVPEPGWLTGLADWCRERGILLIADEVQTGFGRTGAWFACEHEGVVPDLITTAKSLGGGLPIGGITGRAEIMDAVHSGGLAGPSGATRWPAPPLWRRSESSSRRDCWREPAPSARPCCGGSAGFRRGPGDRPRARQGGDGGDRVRGRRRHRPRSRDHRPGPAPVPPGRADGPQRRDLRQRDPPPPSLGHLGRPAR